jgi:glycerol-3-phosphate acyltransferase PlsX
VREKKDSSMTVGLRMLADGQGGAFVSAGSTGALLAGATLIVKRVRGIRRAALAPFIPHSTGGFVLIDGGANTECTLDQLVQFAFMGSYYAEYVRGVKNPRVGLLCNGAEDTKGTQLIKSVFGELKRADGKGDIRFAGNIEAKDVFSGVCDVLVCDGFSGNILLKAIEGTASYLMREIKEIYHSGAAAKLAGRLVKKELTGLRDRLNPDNVGGVALLGISKPCVKAHGSSGAAAVRGAIRQAVLAAEANVAEKLLANMSLMSADQGGGKQIP